MQALAASTRSLRVPSRLLPGTPDEQLVAALRRGDERAFEAIYDSHHHALLGFCRHMLGSREEAEDALQQVFVAAHRHLLAGTERVQLKPWLYAIARNRCLSMLRARRDTCALEPAHEASTSGLAVADEVERREDVREMLGDLTRLPDDQRAALLLAELGDLSQKEIAAALEVRPVKVKALIFQAREALAGWRQARTTDCREIQEQLATLRGSALRRAPIRRHVAVCPACEAFEREVARQRASLALLLPVVPTAALKHSVLSSALSAGGGAASVGAAGVAASGVAVSAGGAGMAGAGASGFAVKALAAAALAIGAGGGAVAVSERTSTSPPAAATTPARTLAGAATPTTTPVPAAERAASGAALKQQVRAKRDTTRGRSAYAPGHSGAREGNRGRSAEAPGHSGAREGNRGRSADAPGHSGERRGQQPKANGRRGAENPPSRANRTAPPTSRRADKAKSPPTKSPAAKAPAAKGGSRPEQTLPRHGRSAAPAAPEKRKAGNPPPAAGGEPAG